jgi:hypothetical protein
MENSTLRLDSQLDTWSYEDHEEFALICAHQAYATANDRVATELWRMAKIHQAAAAKLCTTKLVNLREPPPWVQGETSV